MFKILSLQSTQQPLVKQKAERSVRGSSFRCIIRAYLKKIIAETAGSA